MKLFVNTKTKECGMYDPSDLDDQDWIEAPKGTQAVYIASHDTVINFYKIEDGVLCVNNYAERDGYWRTSNYNTPTLLAESPFMTHLWGTLPDFEF